MGMLFAFCLVAFSAFAAYRWVIKPDRESRGRRARRRAESDRARHWFEWRSDETGGGTDG